MDVFTSKINWHCKCWNIFTNKTDKVKVLHYTNLKIKIMGKNNRKEINLDWNLSLWEEVMDF